MDIIENKIDTSVSCDQNFNQWQCSIIVTCLLLFQSMPPFIFPFLIDIIDSVTIRPYHVTRTPTTGSAVLLSRDTDGNTW